MNATVTRDQFFTLAREIGQQAGLIDSSYRYFENHRERLWTTVTEFGLQQAEGGQLLDIGPYFSFSPFLMSRAGAGQVFVFEGESVYDEGIAKAYADWKIRAVYGDLQKLFGGVGEAMGRLPYQDGQFDVVLCWETMEHFNFNPVPFVRELHRVVKPGGRVCITVPNMAKLDKRLQLLLGRSPLEPVEEFVATADSRFLGTHWREYTLAEITRLFASQGFQVTKSKHLLTFQNQPQPGPWRQLKRCLIRLLVSLIPSFGTLCVLEARRN